MRLEFQEVLRASTKPLICLKVNASNQLLASSAEDGALKIWDLTRLKVKHAFLPQCFAQAPVTCIQWHGTSLLTSAGRSIYQLDALPATSLFIKEASCSWLDIAEDEINSFHHFADLNLIVFGDDSGNISLLDMKTGKCQAVGQGLRHAQICTALAALPVMDNQDDSTLSLVSGGLDCLIKQWTLSVSKSDKDSTTKDVTEPQMPSLQLVASINTAENQDPNATQLFNPPYVQAIAAHSKAAIFAAGLGDGSLLVAQHSLQRSKHQNKRLKKRVMRHTWTTTRMTEHSHAVGAVCVIHDGRDENAFLVASGSSDCTVNLWRFNQDSEGRLVGEALAKYSLSMSDSPRKPKINCVTSFTQGDLTILLVGDVLGHLTLLNITDIEEVRVS
jgi:WD40 repeat protein